jgi:hypothetical protein
MRRRRRGVSIPATSRRFGTSVAAPPGGTQPWRAELRPAHLPEARTSFWLNHLFCPALSSLVISFFHFVSFLKRIKDEKHLCRSPHGGINTIIG